MAGADDARSAVFSEGHLGAVSDWMTPTVATALEFHELVPYKSLLKRFFSAAPWTDEDAAQLSTLVAPKLAEGWNDQLELPGGLVVSHGVVDGYYSIEVRGTAGGGGLWDRVFAGPVTPEATPHPRKVKFHLGGEPAPGRWYRRSDEVADPAVARLFDEDDVTDVMVAGDFVTVGLERGSRWETRLDDVLELVTRLFPHGPRHDGAKTREELVAEGRALDPTATTERLHLLDPDEPAARELLLESMAHADPRVRRVAVVVLAESTSAATAHDALRRGAADVSLVVRRASLDAAADRGGEELRGLFEAGLRSADAWQRWRAVRALRAIGLGQSRDLVGSLVVDEDFQVRLEAERALRDAG